LISGGALYRRINKLLLETQTPEPEAKARVLIAHALQTGLGDIFLQNGIDDNTAADIENMARRCANGEPVEYVTGQAYFRGCTFDVSPAVLIPRQETELVAGAAIELINANNYNTALDLCTGSGCIAVALAAETTVKVDACDISGAALDTARLNARINNVQINFFNSDMFGSVKKTYDIIISNPPYVSEVEYAELECGVKLYEPRLALIAGDGLYYYKIIAKSAARCLNPKGALVLEIGARQAGHVKTLLSDGGFSKIDIERDYSGRDRVVTARI